jgi:hypothetical protein
MKRRRRQHKKHKETEHRFYVSFAVLVLFIVCFPSQSAVLAGALGVLLTTGLRG